ncbi:MULTISPECIES: ATP-dependent DNA ligase [Mesorhizobium]|uniref:ATP dependent DNA ligase n=1 Tax=Mesorhizobium opportunistum (strain LMG 24607 / HAMBI 3007 / WSM2075) TaxID=536019 RepID=F7Y3K3_MESOW|nr:MULTISPECIES: ATP-dependent DNA ligase [Mesorhizobium]AEH88396.1 ATP dependent DNA ligase [Mesorhizobium opportunistum WSM2075]MCA0034088.1 hypothetical protein [Mesorhizobium sp. B263B2A]TPN48211.1 hypothetical protein FJ978_21620 [Mesorhizobium sp. B1-1-7]TPN52614.1 hypothetical protein FJ976_12630 [Mesorhizobium sp. B1-1-9]
MRLKFIHPMEPELVDTPPQGDDWLHEIKFDGYRTQVIKDKDGIRLITKNGYDWTGRYIQLAGEAAAIEAEDFIIDGEAITINEAGLAKADKRQRLWDHVQGKIGGPASARLKSDKAEWLKPGLVGRVRFLKGEEKLRHAKLLDFRDRQ